MKRKLLILAVVAAAIAGGVWWWFTHRPRLSEELVLYGNMDLRQVQLAFNNSERISKVNFEEGTRVRKDEVVAELDTSRLAPQVAQAQAQVATQQQVVDRLRNGTRPEEVAQSEANVEAAKADLVNARRQFERLKKLSVVRLGDNTEARAVSQEDLDNARAALDVAEAKLTVNQKALDLAIKGPREEEKKESEARLRAYEAQRDLLEQQLKDAVLKAPTDAVIRSRLMEPGEMASPQRPVYTLAINDRKWVRAYVSEPDLGKVREGMKAQVAVDSFPDRRFEGIVGFISPVAEFTPKAVQTEELRTSLVYEVRVNVKDPDDVLRLGAPATVYLSAGGTR
jgi:HlyD family secretion protein